MALPSFEIGAKVFAAHMASMRHQGEPGRTRFTGSDDGGKADEITSLLIDLHHYTVANGICWETCIEQAETEYKEDTT